MDALLRRSVPPCSSLLSLPRLSSFAFSASRPVSLPFSLMMIIQAVGGARTRKSAAVDRTQTWALATIIPRTRVRRRKGMGGRGGKTGGAAKIRRKECGR